MQTILESSTKDTLASVLLINDKGILLSVLGQAYFLPYSRVPWMRDATVNDVMNVRMCGRNAIEWPALDVDLEIDSLRHPERYPLVIRRNEFDNVV